MNPGAADPDFGPLGKDGDLYGWARRTAALLRQGRVGEVDLEAVAEEIDDVGEEQYIRLESALRGLMDHLLKWDHLPAARSRVWAITVREQRRRVERLLRKNPGLESRLDEAFVEAWEDARDGAARETGLPTHTFPPSPPFAFGEIMGRPILWPGEDD